MRHVKELKLNGNFRHKDDFRWEESGILLEMTEMIFSIGEDVQEFFEKNPVLNYSSTDARVFTLKEIIKPSISSLEDVSLPFIKMQKKCWLNRLSQIHSLLTP